MNKSTTKTRVDYSYFFFLMREKAREKKNKKKKRNFSLLYAYIITCVDNHVIYFCISLEIVTNSYQR